MRPWLPTLLLLVLLPLPAASAVETPPCPFSECGRVVANVDCLGHAVVAAAGESLLTGTGDWLLVIDASGGPGVTYHNERRWDADHVSAFVDYAAPGILSVQASLYFNGKLEAHAEDSCLGPV
jgi:hypothetical protein